MAAPCCRAGSLRARPQLKVNLTRSARPMATGLTQPESTPSHGFYGAAALLIALSIPLVLARCVGLVRTRIVKILISHSEPISSSIDQRRPSRFFIRNRPTASTIYGNRLVSSLSVVAINNAFAQRLPQPQPHSYRPRLGHHSRGVSVVVTQEPAQPLATLYSFITTSFRDLRKRQHIGLPLMISLSVIVHNVFAHRSS